MIEDLRKQVREGNQKLAQSGLVQMTFGNLSAIDSLKQVYIKPSGVPYDDLKNSDIVILNLDGKVIEGDKRPSSDTPTHLELYRNFSDVGAIIHIHSGYTTSFAQAQIPIKCFGTTHADFFYGEIPVTEILTSLEVNQDYELNTGKKIVETFKQKNLDPLRMPACLVANHGPFVWGKTIENALENAFALEEVAKLNLFTLTLNRNTSPINQFLLDKHYNRKHGKNAYYGQD